MSLHPHINSAVNENESHRNNTEQAATTTIQGNTDTNTTRKQRRQGEEHQQQQQPDADESSQRELSPLSCEIDLDEKEVVAFQSPRASASASSPYNNALSELISSSSSGHLVVGVTVLFCSSSWSQRYAGHAYLENNAYFRYHNGVHIATYNNNKAADTTNTPTGLGSPHYFLSLTPSFSSFSLSVSSSSFRSAFLLLVWLD